MSTSAPEYDVAVVGAGPAGLSAAVALARSLRSVVVVDAGQPRNAASAGAHNVLGHEGVSPLELLAAGRAEAQRYGAVLRHDEVVHVTRSDDGFRLTLRSDGTVSARRLLLATGLADQLPDVPGVRELWGRGVLHCPYCHGWEVRGRRIGVLGTSPLSVHQALLFRQLSAAVTFFEHRVPALDDEARAQLEALDIALVPGAVDRLRVDDGVLTAVVLADGPEVGVDALVVAPRFVARAALYEQLGGTLTDHPVGAFVETGPMGRTDIPGVWVTGNTSDLAAMVAVAAGAGVMAGAAINADLLTEDVATAVRTRSASS